MPAQGDAEQHGRLGGYYVWSPAPSKGYMPPLTLTPLTVEHAIVEQGVLCPACQPSEFPILPLPWLLVPPSTTVRNR